MKNSEILNKGCQVRFVNGLYFCYNVTSTMHFVKCGANGAQLKLNKANALNLKKEQIISLIDKGAAFIEVGSI